MGYGREKAKHPCKVHHHFMRNVEASDGKVHPVPVGLGRSLSTDFCLHCRFTRAELEAL